MPRAVCVGSVPQKTALFDHHGVQCFESVYIIFDNCIGIRGIECQGAVNQKIPHERGGEVKCQKGHKGT